MAPFQNSLGGRAGAPLLPKRNIAPEARHFKEKLPIIISYEPPAKVHPLTPYLTVRDRPQERTPGLYNPLLELPRDAETTVHPPLVDLLSSRPHRPTPPPRAVREPNRRSPGPSPPTPPSENALPHPAPFRTQRHEDGFGPPVWQCHSHRAVRYPLFPLCICSPYNARSERPLQLHACGQAS